MNKLPSLVAVEKALCSKSLAEFTKCAWSILEPASPLAWGWCMDAVCEHLEAVTNGEIKKLLINIPPGCMKSLLVGVFWPAWEWGPKNMPGLRYLGTAHKEPLALRDNIKCRRLITSDWYQERWPIKLNSDQNAKTKFENDQFGFREAMAFNSLTGSRGDRVILDDPLSVDDSNSDAALKAAEITFKEALPTRVNNKNSAIVVIMQRLHENDTSGIILKDELGFDHLCLPMRFEEDRRCVTSIGFVDPRQKEGELLFPERFNEEQVNDLEKVLGPYATAGQLQQRPAPREGALFKREWFQFMHEIPQPAQIVRGWDLAATAGGGDRTVGVKMARLKDGRYLIMDVITEQLSGADVLALVQRTAKFDGYGVTISLPQDPGQAGKYQASDYVRQLAGFDVRTSPETGSKVTRALPLASQAAAGNVLLLNGSWVDSYLDEICMFPNGRKDKTDASSRAFGQLIDMKDFDITALI